MAGPYRCVNMVLSITVDAVEYTVGVVEGVDIDMSYAGGAEPYYGSRIRRHSAGSKAITFTLTRWFMADSGQEDLLLNLMDNETEFSLSGYLVDGDGVEITHTMVTITGCRLYRWRPRTGGADDIIGEEASGQGTNWTLDVVNTSP
jgi:hypothetical protein